METGEMKNCFQYRCRMSLVMMLAVLCMAAFGSVPPISILLVRPEGSNFTAVVKGITDDLGSDAEINELIVDDQMDKHSITTAIKKYKPMVIVLLDNVAIRCYREYAIELPDSVPIQPSIILMGIMVEKAIAGIRNAEAIAYEIPIVTSAVNLRTISGLPITKIGVVNRKLMDELVMKNKESCSREGISIVTRSLPDKKRTMSVELRKALDDLFEKEKVDALWIPNDNKLLTPYLVTSVWIPKIKQYRKPVIVGIESLADPKLDFATLAVLPDHESLGAQVASLIMHARKNDWIVESGKVEPSISVYKILNHRQAARLFNVQENNIAGIDKVLK
jgi:hypothetical protein